MSNARRGILMTASAAALWGTWSIFLRWAALPGLVSGAMFMTMLAIGGLPSQWKHRKRVRPRSAWLWMLLFGVFDAGNTGFFFLAVLHGPVAAATLSHYLAPVITPLVALLLIGERPSRRTYPAAAIGLVGLWLLMRAPPGTSEASASHLAVTCGYGALSAIFYATMVPFGKKLAPHFSPLEISGIHSWLSAALLWAFAPHVAISLTSVAAIFCGGVLCGWIGSVLIYGGVRLIPAGLAAVLTYVEPVVATSIGAFVFHEPLGPTAAIGAALVLGGGTYLAMETLRARPIPDQLAAD